MKKIFLLIILYSSIAVSFNSISDKNPNDNTRMLTYLYREPKIKSDNPPLLILLHGVGSNEQDLFSFADQLPDNFLVVSARGPYTIGENSFAWYQVNFSAGKPVINPDQEEHSRKLIVEFIDELKIKHHFDSSRVYLCGFSQGAIMSYSAGLTRPDKIKGIAVMSGRLLDEVKPLIASKERLAQLNIFVSHGTADQVLDIGYARESVAFLKMTGLNLQYKEYHEGHGINKEMLADLVSWLSLQH